MMTSQLLTSPKEAKIYLNSNLERKISQTEIWLFAHTSNNAAWRNFSPNLTYSKSKATFLSSMT